MAHINMTQGGQDKDKKEKEKTGKNHFMSRKYDYGSLCNKEAISP